MKQSVVYDFDAEISRAGSYAEKYEACARDFGKPDAEPFWIADMDFAAPQFLVDALQKRMDHPIYGYTSLYDEVFDSICWWMDAEHDVTVDPASIILAPSVVSSISNVVRTCSKPGDEVAVLSPVYGPFFNFIKLQDRVVADCPLLLNDGHFDVDYALLEKTLARPEVTLLMLCNPQNPGGRVWTKEELEKLVALCLANDVLLFSDEIHCDIVYEPQKHVSLLSIPSAEKICVVAHSVGKTFNTSGLMASFVVVPDAALGARFKHGAECTHTADINLFGKVALAAAFSPEGVEYKRQLLAYLRENTKCVVERLRAAGIDAIMPEATFLVWSDFRTFGAQAEVFERLLNEANVALSGGDFFGPAGDGWFRINCGHPRAVLMAAVDRIIAAFAA